MYHFAIVALLAIGTIKLVDFIVDLIPGTPIPAIPAIRSVLTFAAASGAVWILDYSVFEGWAVTIRNHGVGVWMSAFMVAGATVPWRAAFHWLTRTSSTIDEPLGEHTQLRRVA